jgi:hypothetical protein
LQGNTVIHTYAPVNYSAGTIDFAVAPLNTGQYTFYASVTSINFLGTQVHASVTQTESVQPPTLDALEQAAAFFEQLGSLIYQNLIITVIVALGIYVGQYAIRKFGVWLSRKLKRDKKDTGKVDLDLAAFIARSMTESPITSQMELARRYSGLSEAEQDVFLNRIPDGVLKNYPVTYLGKQSNLMELRILLDKMTKKKDAPKVFGWLKSQMKKSDTAGSGKK